MIDMKAVLNGDKTLVNEDILVIISTGRVVNSFSTPQLAMNWVDKMKEKHGNAVPNYIIVRKTTYWQEI